MLDMPRCFVDHPASVGETYREHMRTAMSFARPLAKASLAALVHAFLPWLFTTTASATVRDLHERMTRRCAACPAGRLHRPDLFPVQGLMVQGLMVQGLPVRGLPQGWDPAI
jgi:hypothetical protein